MAQAQKKYAYLAGAGFKALSKIRSGEDKLPLPPIRGRFIESDAEAQKTIEDIRRKPGWNSHYPPR